MTAFIVLGSRSAYCELDTKMDRCNQTNAERAIADVIGASHKAEADNGVECI